jgi:hypothetical protein
MKKQCYPLLTLLTVLLPLAGQETISSYEAYIRSAVATTEEIDVFLDEPSWAQFDEDVGYIMGSYFPHDGWKGSRTISTVRDDGARTSLVYANRPVRINAYGNSFTQCHQANDAETWQEYLAGHLGEPIRNYGMGGFGTYQAYRRMLREEQGPNAGEYIMLYIWGDDHIRSLLGCRYALTQEWNQRTNESEGVGRMFHGNFWSNIEMNLETGELEEHDSRIQEREELYRMTDPDWMYENLKDDVALQLYLMKRGKLTSVDWEPLKRLAGHLGTDFDPESGDIQAEASRLLDRYAYAATRYILTKSKAFAEANGKKLMILLFDPNRTMRQMLQGEPRVDQEIVDFLEANEFNTFDMNRVHVEDFKSFNLDVSAYYKRYFIGHYNPTGNHFFAYSLAPKVVEWLDPKPITYRKVSTDSIDFKDYLEGD